ncbi:hypothetical protein AB0M39_04940 [Streptomyces sp. NPDC051907]|uniref:hypothetical protein n=1 Tax=Streptomyces sp. NPDC051907 TaxID=3155284 RepID=UPI003442FBAA
MALLAAVASGCGSGEESQSSGKGGESSAPDPKSDGRLMSQSLKELKGYRSARLQSSAHDLRGDRDGNCAGKTEKAPFAFTEVIAQRGERAWIRLDDEMLKQYRQLATVIGPEQVAKYEPAAEKARGKWIELTPSEMKDDETLRLCDLDRGFASIPESVESAKRLNPGTTRYEARDKPEEKLIPLVQQPEDDGVTVYLSVKGGTAPQAIEFEIDDEPVSLTLSEVDKPVKVVPPQPSEIVPSADVADLYPDPEVMRKREQQNQEP